jgi:hypothetical protein
MCHRDKNTQDPWRRQDRTEALLYQVERAETIRLD